MNRRLPKSLPGPKLETRDPDAPTPCRENHHPFDVLMDYTAGAKYRYAVRAAAAMCQECPIQKTCHAQNKGQGWLRAISTSGEKRDPTTSPSCGKARGVEAHRKRNEFPCTPCRDAYNAQQRIEKQKRRAAKKKAAA